MLKRLSLLVLAAWLALLAAPAMAQTTPALGLLSSYPVVSASYTGPGDVVASALHWWGVFAYSSATRGQAVFSACYSGTCSNVSTGATTGKLPASITINGGNCASVTCTIQYFYDFGTGTAIEPTSATANQPVLTSNCGGSGQWGAYYDIGVPNYAYATGSDAAQSQPIYMVMVSARTSGTSTNSVVAAGTNDLIGFANSSGTVFAYAGTNTLSATGYTEGGVAYMQAVLNGAAGTSGSLINLNGTETTTGSNPGTSGISADAAYGLGSNNTGAQELTGCVFAGGVWQTATQPNSTVRASMNTALEADFP